MSDNASRTLAPVPSEPDRKRVLRERVLPWLHPLLPYVFFLLAAWLLHHEFKSIKAEEVASSLRSMPIGNVLAAMAFTLANYMVLIGYDWFGVRLVRHPLSLKQVTVASLLAYAFGNSLGVLFGGTPIRVRLYSAWGMSGSEIIRLLIFISMAFWMGLFSLAGVLFLASPFAIPDRFHLPLSNSQPIGVIMLVVVVGFFIACLTFRKPIKFFNINIQPPPSPSVWHKLQCRPSISYWRQQPFMSCSLRIPRLVFWLSRRFSCSRSLSPLPAMFPVDWVFWSWCW